MTGEMVEELILAGADIIKVGIGPGDQKFDKSITHHHLKDSVKRTQYI